MNQTNYLKLFSILAFAVFAGFSCWATAESLQLFTAKIPVILCWLIAIGFFVLASIGTKLILDSLNQNIYCEGRGGKLVLGIVMVLVFWIMFSMPTNTHTFLYRDNIHEMVSRDITTSKEYLTQIANNQVTEEDINRRIAELEARVNPLANQFIDEIDNPLNPGDGPDANKKRIALLKALDMPSDTRLYISTGNHRLENRELVNLQNEYRKQIADMLEQRINAIRNSAQANNAAGDAEILLKEIDKIEKDIKDESINLNDRDEIGNIVETIEKSYALIANNLSWVNINPLDKATFENGHPVTNVKRLMSVYDVWMDMFRGDLHAGGFAFWLIISILVDVAAFIFFDIAFK